MLACMASLAGCNISSANQGSVSSWFSMRAGDPPSFITDVIGFKNTGSNDPSTRPTLRFRNSASKIHAIHVTASSYSELFSLVLTPRYYELYELEVRHLSCTVTCETDAYEERCEANGEALEKTVQKRKRSVTHTLVNAESNCRSMLLTKTDYYYETYTSKPFSALSRAESSVTNYIGDFRVQRSYEEKKGKILVDSCRLSYGTVSRDRVDAQVAQMNEADKDKREPLPLVRQQAVDTEKVGKFIHLVSRRGARSESVGDRVSGVGVSPSQSGDQATLVSVSQGAAPLPH